MTGKKSQENSNFRLRSNLFLDKRTSIAQWQNIQNLRWPQDRKQPSQTVHGEFGHSKYFFHNTGIEFFKYKFSCYTF